MSVPLYIGTADPSVYGPGLSGPQTGLTEIAAVGARPSWMISSIPPVASGLFTVEDCNIGENKGKRCASPLSRPCDIGTPVETLRAGASAISRRCS